AVKQNQNVARFGLVKMRQNGVTQAVQCSANATCQVNLTDPLQSGAVVPTESGSSSKWWVARPTVAGNNSTGAAAGNVSPTGPVLAAAETGCQRQHPDDSLEEARRCRHRRRRERAESARSGRQ